MNTDNTKTSQNRQKKEKLVAEYAEKVQKAQGIVFTNFQGLTHQQLEGLKKGVQKLDADYVATKNSLIQIALKEKYNLDDVTEHFTKPTATLFMYSDVVEPLKHLAKTVKELKLPEIKFGLIDGKVASGKEVIKLSTLPPLPVLRAQLLGQMLSPVQGLHRALNWNLQQFVMTLNAIKEKKA